MKFFATVLAASVLAQTAYAAALPSPAGNALVARGKGDKWSPPVDTCGYFQNPADNVCTREMGNIYAEIQAQYTEITKVTVEFDGWVIPVLKGFYDEDDSSSSDSSDDEHHHHHHLSEAAHKIKEKAHRFKHEVKHEFKELGHDIQAKFRKIHMKLHAFHMKIHAWKEHQLECAHRFFHYLKDKTRQELIEMRDTLREWKEEILAGLLHIEAHFKAIFDELKLCGDAFDNTLRLQYMAYLEQLSLHINQCRAHVGEGIKVYASVYATIDTHTEFSGTVKVGQIGGGFKSDF